MPGPFASGSAVSQNVGTSTSPDPFGNAGYVGAPDPFAAQGNTPDPFAVPALPDPGMQSQTPDNPNAVPRAIDNPVNIIGNAFLDVIDMGQGLGALGSGVAARVWDVAHGQFPIQPKDVDTLGQIGNGMLDFYNKTYLQPLAQGRPQDIATYALQHPFDFALDATAVGKFVKAPQLAARAATLPGINQGVKFAQAVGQGTKALAGGIEQTVRASETFGPIYSKVDELAKTYAIKNEVLGNTERLYANAKRDLDAALAAVPEAERPYLLHAAEGTDPRLLEQGYAYLSDPAKHYIETARKYMSESTGWELQQGRVSASQAFQDRYLPALEAMKTVFGYTDEDLVALMNSPKDMEAALKAVKERLNAKGVEPIYQGRLSSKKAQQVINDPLKIPAFTLRVAGEGARASTDAMRGIEGVKNVVAGPKEAFEYARTQLKRGEHFSHNSHEVTLARYTQAAQLFSGYQTMLKKLLEQADNPVPLSPATIKALETGRAIRFKPQDLFARVLKDGGFSESELSKIISNTLPEEFILPAPVAKAFENVATQKPSYISKLYTGFANFARRYVLGFNIAFPEWQGAQNFVMLGLTQFTGPRDAFVSFMSYALAADKKLNQIMPPELVGEALSGEATIAALPRTAAEVKAAIAPALGQLKDLTPKGFLKAATTGIGLAGKGLEKSIDFTFARTAYYDRITRVVAAGYYALKLSEKYPELGGPIRGMLSNGEAINRIQAVMNNSARQAEVSKRVLTVLGDYGRLQSQKRALLRSTFLWWNWYEAIVKFGVSLPQTNPYKVAILKRAADMVPELIQDANLPEGLRKAGAVGVTGENDQGIPKFVLKGGLNPFVSISEIAEMLAQPFEGNESSTVLGGMNPIFPILTAQVFRVNPQTGREFSDPRLIHQDGKQYKPEDVLAGRLIEQKPAPNLLEYTLRTLAPQPVRFAERLTAKATTGGEPSQFTSAITAEGAPRILYNSGGEPLAAASFGDIFLEGVLGIRAMPIDTDATQRIESLQGNTLKKAMKSAGRQINPDAMQAAYDKLQ